MIRGLLITAVVSFLVAVVCFTGAASLGGGRLFKDPPWMHEENDKSDASSEMTTRDIPFTVADKLTVNAPAEVIFTQGPTVKLSVTGHRSAVDRIKAADGDIDLEGRGGQKSFLIIKVEAPSVTSFRFRGGQSVRIDGYAQDHLQIEADGAVALEAKGAARAIDLRLNGASHADLRQVVSDEAKVEINGASHAMISPKSSADIRINGVGNVSLASRPARISKEIHGVGSVSYDDEHDGDDKDRDKDKGEPAPAPRAPPAKAPPAPAATT